MVQKSFQRRSSAVRPVTNAGRESGRSGGGGRSVAADKRSGSVLPALIGGLFLIFGASHPVADAADITVNSLVDEINSGDGNCTLREALSNANAAGGGDSTDGDCAAGDSGTDDVLFNEDLLGGTVTMIHGQFEITDSVQLITDLSPDRDNNITLDAGMTSRVLDIRNPNNRSPMRVATLGLGFTNGRLEQADASGAGVRAVGTGAARIALSLGRCLISLNNNAGADGAISGNGGGLFASMADVSLRSCIVEGNQVGGSFGAGLALQAGNHEIIDSEIIGNFANDGAGGGIFLDEGSNLTVETSRIEQNSTSSPSAAEEILGNDGGGVLLLPQATVQILDSAVRGNIAGRRGGGIFAFGVGGSTEETKVTVERSALVQNGAGLTGGAVGTSNADLSLQNSTVSTNVALAGAGALALSGGNVRISFSTITQNGHPDGETLVRAAVDSDDTDSTIIEASIIAGNLARENISDVFAVDLDRGPSDLDEFTSLGNNIIGLYGDDDAIADDFDSPGDQLNVRDPMLEPLDFYGGNTRSHVLLGTSPALEGFQAFTPDNNADGGSCPPPAMDQRGMPRPFDGDLNGDEACDIGAVENGPRMDLGDAADTFPVLLADNGAVHLESTNGPLLGSSIDFEFDGQPSFLAEADDLFDGNDDEDGVEGLGLETSLTVGQQVNGEVRVTTTRATGLLNAWIDFDDDGAWEASERIVSNVSIDPGNPLDLQFSVPEDAVESRTYARFRVSRELLSGPGGVAQDGEVEDYVLHIQSLPLVSLSPADVSFAETGQAEITIELSRTSPDPVIVSLGYGGDAVRGEDFNGPLSVIVPADTSSVGFTLTGIDDDIFEDDETFSVSIMSAENALVGEGNTVSATIDDAADRPLVTLALSEPAFAENGGTSMLTAALSNPATQNVTLGLAFTGMAVRGTDYTADGQLVIPADSLSGQIELSAIDDDQFEGDEQLTVGIDDAGIATLGDPAEVSATIIDDERPDVTLSIDSASIDEPGGSAQIIAELSSIFAAGAVTVDLAFSGEASPADFDAASSITIEPGSLTGATGIVGVDDNVFEGNESLTVNIASATNAVPVSPSSVNTTILEDEEPPTAGLSALVSRVTESGGPVSVDAFLSGRSAFDTNVPVLYYGDARIGEDFTGPSSVMIPAGETRVSFELEIINDADPEPDERVVLALPPTLATDRFQSDTLFITDDDGAGDGGDGGDGDGDEDGPLPVASLAIDTALIAESGGVASVTATLDAPATSPVNLNIAFDGEAAEGSDYVASTTALSIPTGATSASLTLTGLDDAIDEPDESLVVMLAGGTGATVGDAGMVSAAIIDDDGTPSVGLSVNDARIPENAGATTVTATLSNASAQAVTIDLVTGGGGTDGTDHSLTDISLIIPAGMTSVSTTLTGIDDASHEPDELVIVGIGNAANATIGLPVSAGVILIDDDEPEMGEPREDRTDPVTDTLVAAGQRQVPVLSFGLTSSGMDPAVIRQVTAVADTDSAAVARVRLYLDSNGDGAIQDGEPLVSETTEIGSDGSVVFDLSAPLAINGGQTINFLLTADAAAG